jgi:S-DNA-T family DNA segregation ATPase FtsK/SpoIIIE
MATEPIGSGRDAEVIPLHPDAPGADPPPRTMPAGQRRPVVPAQLRRENIGATVRHYAGHGWHTAKYHGFRSPAYLAVYLWHALRGITVIAGKVHRWRSWPHGWLLESQAVAVGRAGHSDALAAHKQRRQTTSARGKILAACAIAALAMLIVMILFAPWWAWAMLAAAIVAVLAWHGRQPGKPIAGAAVVPQEYEKLTTDIITRALNSLGVTGIDRVLREGKDIVFVTPVTRDGPGWRVALDLPYGVTAADVVERRDKLASGLRRPAGCVWPEADPGEHAGRLVLYVCDQPLNKMRQPAWPLAAGGSFSLFRPLPFGTDQRGRPVSVLLMFANLLIGSIPRMGKTVALRNVLLAAALDPTAELHVHELKGTGDLAMLGQVAHAYGSGADDETIAAALADLRTVHAELDRRARVIKGLPRDVCPDSKVTPELAAARTLRLHPLVFAIDECQEAFGHPAHGADFGRLAEQIIRRGPALGIMLVLATQRPDARSLPTGITTNVAMRFCLRVMDQVANDMVLGTSAYKRGINAALFGLADKGIGWALGFAEDTAAQVVKSYNVNGPAAERACLRARAARQAAGLLTGQAAGDAGGAGPRSFAADVLAVFDAAPKLWTSSIASRLAERMPDVYADITPAAVASQLRGLGVAVKNVREPGGQPAPGAERTAVEAVTG